MTDKLPSTSISSQKYERVTDLPESLRVYNLTMSNKASYMISGEEVLKIMDASTNFIRLKSGSIINKAFILEIVWDKKETIEKYRKLTSSENTT